MGFLDAFRRAVARHRSGSVAAEATRSIGATVEALADDLASAAEAELAERHAARDGRLAALEDAAVSIREERAARRAAAVEELARRKEEAAADQGGPHSKGEDDPPVPSG
ncbi:MAG: hypothetical protein VX265_09930 [Myxococcota bacterium]|nr:hypothetical protein [Myxococcota bacterium]MEC8425563.1 hypothetical protein [Myxococcota bacterium]